MVFTSLAAGSASAATVTAGNLTAINGDYGPSWQSGHNGFWLVRDQDDPDTVCSLVLDLGNEKTVSRIWLKNPEVATNYVPRRLTLKVAPDESSPSFVWDSLESYTQTLDPPGTQSWLSPACVDPNVWRTLEKFETTRRYLLVNIEDNNWGQSDQIWFKDVDVYALDLSDPCEPNDPCGTLPIVEDGAPTTAIIVPAGACPDVVIYAAEELQYHIAQATGATLGIHTEDNKPVDYNGLIYIGDCEAASDVGIHGSTFNDNGFMARSIGEDLYMAGHDSSGEVLGMLHGNKTRIGTLLAVYEFLQQCMGVKWLWPGHSGEVIPTCSDLIAENIDITGKPVLAHTRLRDYGHRGSEGWASISARDKFLNDQSVWMRRHGFCQSIDLNYGHSFEDYWDNYGATHPEYFNLLPDGTRRSDPLYHGGPGRLIAMCMSESALWEQIIDDWVAGGATDYINLSKNDTSTKCTCANCMAWDVEPPDFENNYGLSWQDRLTVATERFNGSDMRWYNSLGPMSERYAKFIDAVKQEATSRGYGDATFFGLAYSNRASAPLETQLNDRVILGIVPAVDYPWTKEMRQGSRSQWYGWTGFAGAMAYLRPNYFLQGHNTPVFIAERFGQDFIYALRRGMVGTDFDSLTGQWGTQAPNLYMLARVQTHVDSSATAWGADLNGDCKINMRDFAMLSNHWLSDVSDCQPNSPCADLNGDGTVDFNDLSELTGQWCDGCSEVEAILDEFYEAFGPAEQQVRAYFAHWESVRDNSAANWDALCQQAIDEGKAGDPADPEPFQWHHFLRAADIIFTTSVMAEGRILIDAAVAAAADDTKAEQKVAFLEKGFTNAELTLAAQAAKASGNTEEFQNALNTLDSYRAGVEADNIANMNFLAWLEDIEGWNR